MTSEHICPRCGYDLSGETSRWVEACPLRGRCPECGTEFEWLRIFYAKFYELPWLVEHGRGVRQFVNRWAPTLARVLWPPKFWREVGVTRPVNATKALLWLLVPCVVMHLIASGIALRTTALYRTGPLFADDFVEALGEPFTGFDWMWNQRWAYDLPLPGGMSGLPAATVTFSLMLALLPWTRHLAKLRTVHLCRAVIYSLWWMPIVFAFRVWRNWQAQGSMAPLFTRVPGVVMTLPPGTWTSAGTPLSLRYLWPAWMSAALFAWTLWWWWCAITIGWKIDRGRLVWALLATAAIISAMIVGVRGEDLIWIERWLR